MVAMARFKYAFTISFNFCRASISPIFLSSVTFNPQVIPEAGRLLLTDIEIESINSSGETIYFVVQISLEVFVQLQGFFVFSFYQKYFGEFNMFPLKGEERVSVSYRHRVVPHQI
jgi:hypothetical protein